MNPVENEFDDDSVELAASAVNSSVIDDTDEPRTKCPKQYAEHQLKPRQRKNSKAKDKLERIRCRVSDAIFSYLLFITSLLTICKINNLSYISLNSARVACEQEDQKGGGDPFPTLARKEHQAKMRILQLKEWKLKTGNWKMKMCIINSWFLKSLKETKRLVIKYCSIRQNKQ